MREHVSRAALAAALLLTAWGQPLGAQAGYRWKAHDTMRPKPRKVQPGGVVGQAPSDAVVLFDGKDLSQWASKDGSPPKWAVRDGYFETVPGAGPLVTKRAFGDAQIHVEWASPTTDAGSGQNRGNSGVYMMGLYEVQVLDSYTNETYADGQAASLYGQHPPLVNASRPTGEWQSYDIIFHQPRFDAKGAVTARARLTVLHNGVLVQDNAELWGPTNWLHYDPYKAHPRELPIMLQDHDHPVRFRNIWLRPLPDAATDEVGLAETKPALTVPVATLKTYVGSYGKDGAPVVAVVTQRGSSLFLDMFGRGYPQELVPLTATKFAFRYTAGTAEFMKENGILQVRLLVAENDRREPRRP
ncbi:MAG: DUF1080 domain-containing protein [Gemmatimonadaceae bacterium]